MLERSLAMIFSSSQLNLIPKGAIFLLQNEKWDLSAQRGLTAVIDHEVCIHHYVCNTKVEPDRFQVISCRNNVLNQPAHDHFIAPLIRNNGLIGVLILDTAKTTQPVRKNQVKFVKYLAQTLSSLIERKKIVDQLNLAKNVLNYSQQAIFVTDTDYKIICCNPACEQITGYSSEELIGQTPRLFKSDYHDANFYKTLRQQINDTGFWQGEIWNKRKNNTVFPQWLSISSIKDVEHKTTQYLAIFTDLTLIKQAEKDLQHLSFFDPLEPVQDLLSKILINARTTMCRLEFKSLSQFFQRRRHFSNQPKLRSTTQR